MKIPMIEFETTLDKIELKILKALINSISKQKMKIKTTIPLSSKNDLAPCLNCLYEAVKDSDDTVDEVVSYKPNRISFKNGSYIQIEIDD